MEPIKPLLERVDEAIQARVDRTAHAIMQRLNVRKSFLQYNCRLWMFLTFTTAALMEHIIMALPSLFMLFVLLGMRTGYSDDDGQMLYKSDIKMLPRVPGAKPFAWALLLLLCLINLGVIVNDRMAAAFSNSRIMLFSISAAWVAHMFDLYLVKTPKTPPPKEEKQTVLEPQASEA